MKLPTDIQINRVLDLLEKRNMDLGAIDISVNGISVKAKGESGESAFDEWKNNSKDRNAPDPKTA